MCQLHVQDNTSEGIVRNHVSGAANVLLSAGENIADLGFDHNSLRDWAHGWTRPRDGCAPLIRDSKHRSAGRWNCGSTSGDGGRHNCGKVY